MASVDSAQVALGRAEKTFPIDEIDILVPFRCGGPIGRLDDLAAFAAVGVVVEVGTADKDDWQVGAGLANGVEEGRVGVFEVRETPTRITSDWSYSSAR